DELVLEAALELDAAPELDAEPVWTQPPATHIPLLNEGDSAVAHVEAPNAPRSAAAAPAMRRPLCLRGEDLIPGEIEQEGGTTGSFFCGPADRTGIFRPFPRARIPPVPACPHGNGNGDGMTAASEPPLDDALDGAGGHAPLGDLGVAEEGLVERQVGAD